ncbi:hypothetical protein [Nocardia niwae]|nr:hypothetical protein [Nocardia niwae]
MGLLVAMTIPGLAVLLILSAFAEVAWNKRPGLANGPAIRWRPRARRA